MQPQLPSEKRRRLQKEDEEDNEIDNGGGSESAVLGICECVVFNCTATLRFSALHARTCSGSMK